MKRREALDLVRPVVFTAIGKKWGREMRITSKGQVTIPQAVREETGLLPNTEVEFVVDDGTVRIVKTTGVARPSRGATAIRRLRERHGRIAMTTDEIMALTRRDE